MIVSAIYPIMNGLNRLFSSSTGVFLRGV